MRDPLLTTGNSASQRCGVLLRSLKVLFLSASRSTLREEQQSYNCSIRLDFLPSDSSYGENGSRVGRVLEIVYMDRCIKIPFEIDEDPTACSTGPWTTANCT